MPNGYYGHVKKGDICVSEFRRVKRLLYPFQTLRFWQNLPPRGVDVAYATTFIMVKMYPLKFYTFYIHIHPFITKMLSYGLDFLENTKKITIGNKKIWRLKGDKKNMWHMPHPRLKGLCGQEIVTPFIQQFPIYRVSHLGWQGWQ